MWTHAKDYADDYRVTTNFLYGEFKCKHCPDNHTRLELITKLQEARNYSNQIGTVSYKINSGYRCPVHNANIGGVPNSGHVLGVAADIAVTDNHRRMCILYGLVHAGFTRIGIYDTFIHVDIKEGPIQVTSWLG